MKFTSSIVGIFVAATAGVAEASSKPCRASCVSTATGKECTFEVSRDQYASELGYFKFSGESGDCGGTNPTLGIEKGATYYFIQADPSNYYHALGFSYFADGALDDQPELEPGIAGPNSNGACITDNSCPAPMYIKDGQYLGDYSNNAKIAPVTSSEDNFGLDDYEPEFFYPLLDWVGADYKVALLYPTDNDFTGDFFYFCHIHQFMTGRIKFIDANGDPLNNADVPDIPYDYQVPSAYDQTCGTFGLDEFQLPNNECPKRFVCKTPSNGAVAQFADCVDSMNCKMLSGMTTNVNDDNAIALFNHQMIPHHENAVNMCKALLISGEADCADLEDEDDPACVINVICQEIINTQNAQIQTMRGVLDALDLDPVDDCRIVIQKSKEKKPKKTKRPKNAKPTKSPTHPPTTPTCPTPPTPTGDTYAFESRFVSGASSVTYSGQIARHLLIGLQKAAIGAVTAGGAPGDVEAQILKYYDCPGTDCETVSNGISVASPLTVTQSTVGDVSTNKNLVGKTAGNDAIGQHKDWDTEFVGWNDWGGLSPQSPENLVRRWAKVVDDLAQNVGNDPSGNPITKVFVSPQGQDYQQLIQKFVLGAVAFSQGADDYLDDDTPGKGLNADNTVQSSKGTYTNLEHQWDEGYGYFGAAINFLDYTDDEIAKKGGRPDFQGYNDVNADGSIDLKSEYNFGHSLNAAKRDRGSASGCSDLTSEAYNALYAGRKLITEANGALSAAQKTALAALRDTAVGAWEKAIAATVVHYINDCLFDIAQPSLDFYGYAKHWSEAKGFALSFQFNRLSPLSDADFGAVHALLRDAPELDSANFSLWTTDLLAARDLLEAAYGFDPVDVASW